MILSGSARLEGRRRGGQPQQALPVVQGTPSNHGKRSMNHAPQPRRPHVRKRVHVLSEGHVDPLVN